MKLEFSRHIFEQSSNIKFHENLSIENRVVLCGTDRRADMAKLIVVFRNFANAAKNDTTSTPLAFFQISVIFLVRTLLSVRSNLRTPRNKSNFNVLFTVQYGIFVQWEPTECTIYFPFILIINPYPTAFPYGNGMVLHFYQQQESSTTKTVHKVINKGLKAYV